MTGLEDLARRREAEAKRIRALLDGGHENRMADLKIGETAVAFVKDGEYFVSAKTDNDDQARMLKIAG
ncbi:MAG: hypothetical protein ACPGQO_05235, partial [Candidatus Poseidoniaceae archaeon]